MSYLLCLIFALFSTELVVADSPAWVGGVGVGPNLSQLDAIDDELKSSVGGSLWLSREWGERSRLDFAFDYFDFSGTQRNYPSLSAAYGWRFFKSSRLKPFVLIGGGVGQANNFPRAVNSHQASPHFFARGGVRDLLKGDQWSMGLIYDFLYVDLDDNRATSAQLGLPMVTFEWRFPDKERPEQTPVQTIEKVVDGDGDRDGVPDSKDECPHTPLNSRVNSIGCLPKQVVTKTLRIEFETNKYNVRDQYFQVVDEFSKFMNDNPDLMAVIEGHTDSVGSRKSNLILSVNRAKSVVSVLVERGQVDPSRLSHRGFGPDVPIDSNETEEGRARNRRVLAQIRTAKE